MAATQYPIKFGRYTLLRRIAQGGMAEIFLAQDDRGEILALKRILPHLAHEEAFIRMFIDEARIVENVAHANVARVFEQNKHDGYYYLAMEYVEGHSLLALSDRARSMKIPLPRGLLAFVVAELLAGLGHAHAARDKKGRHLEIVHRDVTPQNVMISYGGDVKLIDFGVAKARARLTQTEAGFTKGKLSYMSPEQARGEELDGRSDLFSVGIILYEITTGHRLFNKEGPGGILSAIVNDPIPPPSAKQKDYPKDLESIVMRALEKSADRRWQTAEDMRDALLRFAAREKPKPGPPRLAALVQDLFGDPEHRKAIEDARMAVEATPPGPVAAEVPRGASIRMGGREVARLDDAQPRRADDTRMFDVSGASPVAGALGSGLAPKLEVTRDRLPVLSKPIVVEDDVVVPEPEVPLRVRLARTLADGWVELRARYQAKRRLYLGLLAGGLALGGLGLAAAFGVFGWVSDTAGTAADRAREIRKQAGLEKTNVDAGIVATTLELVTEPPGAAVTIDGVGAGCVTPCTLDAPPVGRPFEVGFELFGYRPRKEPSSLRAGEGKRTLSVTLVRAEGGVLVESDPPGATVTVEGKRAEGQTPLTLTGLRADRPVTIEVRRSGYLPVRQVVVPKDGEEVSVSVSLSVDQRQIPPGRIDVNTRPPGCEIDVGDRPVGTSPLVGHELRPGTYKVRARCQYHAPEETEIDVIPGRAAKVELSPTPNVFGYISIDARPPAGTKVTINGRAIEGPAQFVKVVPGVHVVIVENKGLSKSRRLQFEVGPDKRVERTVDLYQ